MGRKRHLAVGLGLVGAVFLTAGQVQYYEEALPSTMNPLFARSMVDFRTHELVFDRLFYRSAVTNELKSRLVAKHEKIDGGKSLRLTIEDGIKWHDGKEFSSEDVCFTIQAMLDPKTPSPVAKPYREALEGCEADKKSNTVTVHFKKLYHNPRERLGFSVLPQHAFQSTAVSPDLDFSQRPIGTGPMKGAKGRRAVTFTKHDNKHHKAKIGSAQLAEGGDPFVQIRTLFGGGTHGVISVAPPLRPEVAAQDEVALKSYDLRSWWFIAVNTTKGPLQDQRVRQALNYAVDRQELRELTIGVSKDDANPPCEFISGPFVQSSPYYNRQIKVIEKADKGKVAELMGAAGASDERGKWIWEGAPINLRIGMNAPLDGEATDLLNQIGNQLQYAGFDRQVYKIPHDDWNRKAVTGNLPEFELLVGKWSFGLVEDVNALFHTRGGGRGALNIFNYSNPEVDKILGQYDSAKTDTEARDAYHDLHAYLSKDLPYVFLWKLDTKSAWRNEVRNNLISPYYYFTEFDGWRYDG